MYVPSRSEKAALEKGETIWLLEKKRRFPPFFPEGPSDFSLASVMKLFPFFKANIIASASGLVLTSMKRAFISSCLSPNAITLLY